MRARFRVSCGVREKEEEGVGREPSPPPEVKRYAKEMAQRAAKGQGRSTVKRSAKDMAERAAKGQGRTAGAARARRATGA